MRLVEVQSDEPVRTVIRGFFPIDGKDVKAEGLEALTHRPWSGAKIHHTSARPCTTRNDVGCKLMQTGRCGRYQHVAKQNFLACSFFIVYDYKANGTDLTPVTVPAYPEQPSDRLEHVPQSFALARID